MTTESPSPALAPEPPAAAVSALPFDQLMARIASLREQVARAFIGQEQVFDEVLLALLAGGHVLIEGVPGLGKTLLVRALAAAVSCSFGRVQFTPDLMPTDVTGHAIYDPKAERFQIRRGPVFANLLLADEINRAPAKTQAALLECMQEGQVTIEGRRFPLPAPFMVANRVNTSGSGWVTPSTVTWRSSMDSSSAAWVLAGARLISSASTTSVNTGPRTR